MSSVRDLNRRPDNVINKSKAMTDQPAQGERTQLFVTLDDKPQMLNGRLASAEDGRFVITLDETHEKLSGSAVLYFPESDRERALTQISKVEGKTIHCEEGKHISPDKRAYPRLFAGIQVAYQVIRAEQDADWKSGAIELSGPWQEADEYMNFSVTGLAFDGTGTCHNGDHLALEITIGGTTASWRASAVVVRAMPIADDEREELEDGRTTICNIAVSFTAIPDDCAQALVDLTNRVLDRL
jgi:hypothetical protein